MSSSVDTKALAMAEPLRVFVGLVDKALAKAVSMCVFVQTVEANQWPNRTKLNYHGDT